jgi:hypothetical protein
MRFLLPAAIAVALLTGLRSAEADDRPAMTLYVSGTGTLSCGSWTAARHALDRHQAQLDQQWIEGFLTGVGWTSGAGGFQPLITVPDREAVPAWVDNYCRAHPVAPLSSAAAEFSEERFRATREQQSR